MWFTAKVFSHGGSDGITQCVAARDGWSGLIDWSPSYIYETVGDIRNVDKLTPVAVDI